MTGRESRFDAAMVLFLHNRYRTTGGEERVVEDLLWLVREHLGEPAELLDAGLGRARAARAPRPGCCAAGSSREDVARAVRLSGARVVHAHNLLPALGWRALAAARARGRAGGAAPAPVPPRVRGRRVLHARRGVHALPRAQHAARACA